MHQLINKAIFNNKSVPFRLTQFDSIQNFIRHLRSHRHARTDDNSDNDERTGKRNKDNKDDFLFFHKSKGQHILTNTRIIDTIVRKSCVKPTDTVLEIGPGTGNLTLKLLEASEKVVAVEIDKRMVEALSKRVVKHGFQDRLTVISKDAMKTEFPPFDIVVANIPYGISSPLIAKLVFGPNRFRSATLLLQKEFARRLLANPGDSEFNRLAVNVKLVAEVEFVMDVSKREFVPCPKVDSSVVTIRPKAEIPDVNLDEWLAFTRTCFSKKNKTLGATFKQKKKLMELLRLSKTSGLTNRNENDENEDNNDENENDENEEEEEEVSSRCSSDVSLFKESMIHILKSSGFEDKRPSKLSQEELLQLLFLFNQAGVYFHDPAIPRDIENAGFEAA